MYRTRSPGNNCSSIQVIPRFVAGFAELAQAQDDTIRLGVSRAQVDLHVVSTEDDLVATFVKIAGSRRRNRR